MNRTGLSELLDKGENSGAEFKRDKVTPGGPARELAALLNLEGGVILLGVEDDGPVSGLPATGSCRLGSDRRRGMRNQW